MNIIRDFCFFSSGNLPSFSAFCAMILLHWQCVGYEVEWKLKINK